MDTAEPTSTLDRSFLQAVRRIAGFRVSPRQLGPAIEALEQQRRPVTPEAVANLVMAVEQGERSARQRRNADLWRLLGAYLALEGKPAHFEAQRALVGRVRRLLGERLSDRILLEVAVALGAAGIPIEAQRVAAVVRWLESRLGPDLTAEAIRPHLRRAIEATAAGARAQRPRHRSARRT